MDAARGLLKARVIQPGEKLKVYVQGRVQEVIFREMLVAAHPEPELEQRHREAVRLRDAGHVEQAKRLLEELMASERLYLPAAITYSGILRREGNLRLARRYLEMALQVLPDDAKIKGLVWDLRSFIRQLGGN